MHSHPRVLFILKNRQNYFACDSYPYSGHLSSGLFNSAKFVSDMLSERGYVSKVVHAVDANSIHKEAVAFHADVVIIEAFWVVPSKFDELKRVLPHVKFVVRNHSDLAFLASEGNAMTWILEYLKRDNVTVACNSLNAELDLLYLAIKTLDDQDLWKTAYLPNYYPIRCARMRKQKVGKVVDVGCFGAIRPLKNQLIQAVAAIKLSERLDKPVRFHINGTRVESNGNGILKNIIGLFDGVEDCELVMHPWMDHSEFIKLVRSMDVCAQVSLSETFNIVVADAVVQGIPVVVSDQIHWIPKENHANAYSSSDIAFKMERALARPHDDNIRGLALYNDASVDAWEDFLSSI